MTTSRTFRIAAAALLLGLALLALDVHAQINSAGVMDDIAGRYRNAAAGWSGVITKHASWLFWSLVIISMVWTFGFMALRRADSSEFFAESIRFVITTGFFWWLLINAVAFSTSIMDSLRRIAGEATSLGAGTMSPSGIVDIGFAIFG